MSGRANHHLYDQVKVTDAAQTAQAAADQAGFQSFDKALQGDTNQFTLIPDPAHGDQSRLAFLSDNRAMEALQKNGFKRIGLERPGVLQIDADNLAAGRISEDEFVEKMKKKMATNFQDSPEEVERFHHNTAKLILNAQKHGIKVDFMDVDYEGQKKGGLALQKKGAYMEKQMKAYANLDPNSEAYKSAYRSIEDAYDRKEILGPRMKGDIKTTVPHIKETVGKDKTLIFYGKEHVEENMGRGLATSTANGKKPTAFNQGQRGVTQIDLDVSKLGDKPTVQATKQYEPHALASRLSFGGPTAP